MKDRTRVLIFDPFSGISGDMILGALVDVGVPLEWLREIVHGLGIGASVDARSVRRGSLATQHVTVHTQGDEPERHLDDILDILQSAPLDSATRDIASSTFRRLAAVEAAIHGVTPQEVHFHEVGASDAIVDIVGAAAGVGYLDIERCYTRPVAVGRGWVTAEHGALPLPAPATLKLLEGLALVDADHEAELTTPTGAALLSELTEGNPAPSGFIPVRSGFGAGTRDPATYPNCLRLVVAEIEARANMVIMQADLDDLSPEYLPPLREALEAAGATDVWTFPVQMKKGRTGIRIEALVPADLRETVGKALFENSTTIGFRYWHVEREVLPRAENRIEWRGFPIRIKISCSAEGHVICKPEYDDILQAARALGLPPLKARHDVETLLNPREDG
ncbi:MAG: hypothetical protein AMS21_07145 [Gemmatimonas sp. SG8_38_2]|nr:MAG: hypothetical protein AMS21_07145 [Gemmatimonas sp. SG8_38_2]